MYKGKRLIHVIGKLKLFFSLDPDYRLCNRCRMRRAVHLIEQKQGMNYSENTRVCSHCYEQAFKKEGWTIKKNYVKVTRR